MIKALIVDDEVSTLTVLRILIERYVPEITELYTANGAQEGFNAIHAYQPNLVFLDIQMPVMSGFELLEKFYPDPGFDVVFVTAYDQYAIKAIRFSAIDYLVKPVDVDELKNAMQRYLKKHFNQDELRNRMANFLTNMRLPQSEFKLALSTSDGTFFIKTNDIIRCEADTNYTNFILLNQKAILTSKTLKEYEELLNEHNFIRVHKSHLVNRKFIKSITTDHELILTDNSKVEISRRKFPEVKRMLQNGLYFLFDKESY